MSSSSAALESNVYLLRLKELIEKAKTTNNFYRVAAAIIPIIAEKEYVICELKVDSEHVNTKKTMHGGQTASFIDIITTWATKIRHPEANLVTLELACSYLNPIPLGEDIIIHATLLKQGRTMIFSECELRRKSDNKILAKGKHTMCILTEPVISQPETPCFSVMSC